MTPTATYIAEENCLQELPRMEKPPILLRKFVEGTTEYLATKIRWDEYNAHLATLRKIPCDPSCKGLWADGQKLVVGKDYEVKMDCKYPVSCFVEETCNCVFTAFPLIPVKGEEEKEMWMDAITIAIQSLADDPFTPGKWLEVVNSKYSLTKR